MGNCYDHSDEQQCERTLWSAPKRTLWSKSGTLDSEPMSRQKCEKEYKEQQEYMSPALRHWWYAMSLPMLVLNIYIGYHSLEFYVQLRIRKFSARMNADSRTATVITEGGEEDTN